MVTKIRHSVFETNSSSTHSISISFCCSKLYETILPDEDGKIVLKGGEFGWEVETYTDALTKANYCYLDQQKNEERMLMLKNLLMEHTGAKEIVFKKDDCSYIDHQSSGTSTEAFENMFTLKSFIFNPLSKLHTDNDNY